MANDCKNHFKLTHADPLVLRRAYEAFESEEFLETLVPPLDNSYSWYIDNWGVKRDVYNGYTIDEPDEVGVFTAYFESAWAPPVEAYKHLITQGFTVVAEYYEPNMGFYGFFEGGPTEGVVVDEDVEITDETELPERIIDVFDLNDEECPEEDEE